MKMNGDLDDMGMQMSLNQMDMNVVMYPEITGPSNAQKKEDKENQYNSNALSDIVTLNYSMLKSPHNTSLPKEAPTKVIKFELSGNMNRYVWSMDNKVVSESDKILIKKGENVKMIIYNGSMMRHPMHLHGHDFRVLNGQGDNAPLKNIIDIMPMETDTLEFNANMEGDWFFHCHILYHMMSGMGRIFSYENQATNPLIPNPKLAQRKLFGEDRKFHAMAIGRYIGKMQWLMPFIGFDWRYRKMEMGESEKNLFGQINTKDERRQISIGVAYVLPMLITFQTEVYQDGNLRLQLMREDIPLSKRLRGEFMVNTDKEFMFGARYIFNKNMGLRTHYDSDMGYGIGLYLNY